MTTTPIEPPRTPPTSRAQRASLLARLDLALSAGTVSADDLEQLLGRAARPERQRPTAASVLYALGAAVVSIGCVLAYASLYDRLPWPARVVTPFVFPVVALAASVVLARRRLGWQSEVAGLVGLVAFAAAFAVSIDASGWATAAHTAAWWIAGAAAVGAAIATLLAATIHRPRVAWIGLPAALGVGGAVIAYAVGVPVWALCWVILVESAFAAATAWRVRPNDRLGFTCAALWSLIGIYVAFIVAASTHDFARFSVWHAVLGIAVAGAFLLAGMLDVDVLMWFAAIGGVLWVLTISALVGTATSAALAVVVAGIALVGLGLVVARVHNRGHRRRDA